MLNAFPARWRLRWSESLLIAYYAYVLVAARLLLGAIPAPIAAVCVSVLLGLPLLALLDARQGGILWSVVRDWAPGALLLCAYLVMGQFQPIQRSSAFENRWVGLDRLVLDGWRLREMIESLGPVLPSLLELSYTLVYVVPPAAVAALYLLNCRSRVDRFYFTLLSGTLLTYALFPYVPSQEPRLAFPGQDLPRLVSAFRHFNLWLLNRFDTHISVFPSGHVTAAFSSAFALMLALPEKKWAGRALLGLAGLVTVATVYGRYHYVIDVLAGFSVSAGAGLVSLALMRRCERRVPG